MVLSVRAGRKQTETANVSKGGMFIKTLERFDLGQSVEVELSFPGLLEPQRVTGVVAWIASGGPATAGIGLAMSEAEQERQPLLRELVEAALAESDPLPRAGDSPYRVLMVDDSINSANLYSHAMRRLAQREWGTVDGSIKLDVAENGARALRLLEENTYELVLTDLFMPVLDGLALIRAVRADPAHKALRILVVSGAEDATLEEAIKLGADGFIQKPMQMEYLLSTVRALLRLSPKGGAK